MLKFIPPAGGKTLSDFSINDPIHGTISLSPTEKKVIDHAYFQRLRRVKALGFLDRVFPSARHSRFEHSIGACHVAGLMFDAIKKNSVSASASQWSELSHFKGVSPTVIETIFSEEYKGALRLAALLHDVGHGPFSHASEYIMPLREALKSSNTGCSLEVLASLGKPGKADHEDFSLLIADRILKDIGLEEPKRKLILSLKDNRVKVGEEFAGEWCKILGGLVSGEFDSDRMDYLRRDSLFCGVPYGNFDFDRLMDGLAVVQHKDGFSFAIKRSSISALEGFLFSRFQMHVQVYTHRVDGSCNKAFEHYATTSGFTLPASIDDYVKMDDETICKSIGSTNLDVVLSSRKLWKAVFESYAEDELNESDLVQALISVTDEGLAQLYVNNKVIKKPDMLRFPVIGKTMLGQLMTQDLKSISQLVDRYNATYKVRRLFVDPSQIHKVEVYKERLQGRSAEELFKDKNETINSILSSEVKAAGGPEDR